MFSCSNLIFLSRKKFYTIGSVISVENSTDLGEVLSGNGSETGVDWTQVASGSLASFGQVLG